MLNMITSMSTLYVEDIQSWVTEVVEVWDNDNFIGYVWFKVPLFGYSIMTDKQQYNVYEYDNLVEATQALVRCHEIAMAGAEYVDY